MKAIERENYIVCVNITDCEFHSLIFAWNCFKSASGANTKLKIKTSNKPTDSHLDDNKAKVTAKIRKIIRRI